MKQPTYKPETWVLYQQDETGGYGEIVGARYEGETWFYTVSGVSVDGSDVSVREEEVKQIMQNGSWLTVAAASASSSAYQDMPAAS